MKIHRFIGGFEIGGKEISVSDPATLHQWREVLHLGPGEEVVLGDGRGRAVLAMIRELGLSEAVLDFVREVDEDSEPEKRVILFASLIKKDNFEVIVQKATEVGAAEIVPVISARTIKLGLLAERLRKIALEAAEQSGRLTVPPVQEPKSLEECLTLADKLSLNIFFDASGSDWGNESLKKKISKAESIGVFIGPEGGWDPKELELVKGLKFQMVSLGKLTLRAETAAVVAMYITTHLG